MIAQFQATLQRGWKAFRWQGGSGGGYPGAPSWFGGVFPLLPGTRYDFRREAGPLHLSGPVLAAIQWLCRTWTEAPSVVYRPGAAGEEEIIRPHPLTDLLARPNRYYDASVLWMGTLLSWVTEGNAYWYIEQSAAKVPVGLVYIPHYRIEPAWPKDGSAYRIGYNYRVDGQTIRYGLDEILHFQNGQDPANEHKGISPLAAELRSICTDNEAQTYMASLLRNMGIPGVVIGPKDAGQPLPPNIAEQTKALFRERFTGDNRGEPLVMSLPIDVQNPGFSPEQLALDKMARLPIPRILAPLGIDPMLLGLPSDTKTYANMEQAREQTYEQVLIPLQGVFDSQLTMQLMERLPGVRPGDRLGRDYTKVRCLQDDQDKLHARLTRAVGGPWLTRNEARAQVGLAPVEAGDELYPHGAGSLPPGAGEDRNLLRAAGLRPEIAARWRQRRALAERNGMGREE